MANVEVAPNFDMSKHVKTVKNVSSNEADVRAAIGFSMCPIHQGTWIARPKTFLVCFNCGTEVRDCPDCHAEQMARESNHGEEKLTIMEVGPSTSLITGDKSEQQEALPPPPPSQPSAREVVLPRRSIPTIRPPPPPKRSVSIIPDDWGVLVDRKLANPDLKMSEDESQKVLLACIKSGAMCAVAAHGKQAIILLGNTGAGKSTCCNYLHGCTMERVLGQKKKIFRVSASSPVPELMHIGHTNVSATFLPDVQPSSIDLPGGAEAVFIDCPGFLDNRGASINIANAVNIKATLNASANARIIIILNYHSLKADRSRGLRELGQILTDLFGSASRVLDNIDSLLLGVTKCPKFDDEGEEPTELEDIRKLVSDGTGLGESMAEVLRKLAEAMFLYHPCDKGNSTWLKQTELVERVRCLQPILEPNGIFQTVLNPSDERELRRMVDAFASQAKEALEEKDYDNCAKILRRMSLIEVVDNIVVTRLLAQAREATNRQLRAIEREAMNATMREGALNEIAWSIFVL